MHTPAPGQVDPKIQQSTPAPEGETPKVTVNVNSKCSALVERERECVCM